MIIILNIFGFDLSDIFDPILKKLRWINQGLLKNLLQMINDLDEEGEEGEIKYYIRIN